MLFRTFATAFALLSWSSSASPVPVPEDPVGSAQATTVGTPTAAIPTTDNATYIYFPKSTDWFTLGHRNAVEWQWNSSKNVSFNVILSNPSTPSLLPSSITLGSAIQANAFGMSTTDPFANASPGEGFVVIQVDAANTSYVWATSETFELKPHNATSILPPPYGAMPDSSGGTARTAGVLGIVLASAATAMLVSVW